MKNTVYAIVAASIAMLATSGIVVLATAAPPAPRSAEHVAMVDDVDVDDYVSELIDREYRKVMARQRAR